MAQLRFTKMEQAWASGIYWGISGNFAPAAWLYNQSNADSYNFGQRPFAYTPPSGHKSLCTQNLDDPTIAQGAEAFEVKLWSGNNADPRSITTSFGPDLVWIKTRNQTNWHYLTDTVRGAPNKLYTNSTNAEDTAPIYGQIDSLNSDGFTLGGGTDSSNPLSDSNQSGTNYVAWAWDAGSSNSSITAGSSNSAVYNESYDISPNTTSTITFGSNQALDKMFNGNTGDKMEPASSGSLDFTSVSGLQNFSGTLQFAVTAYNPNSSLKFVINASTDNLTFTADTFPPSGSFPSTLLTIPVTSLRTLDFTSITGRSVQFWGVYLDGKLLVDSSQTPPNVPSIASTVRANPSTGFSIVSWTGTSANGTIGHGLNAAPEFVIVKKRGGTGNWYCYHTGLTNATKYIWLNSTAAENTQTAAWNSTAPTSNVVHLGLRAR